MDVDTAGVDASLVAIGNALVAIGNAFVVAVNTRVVVVDMCDATHDWHITTQLSLVASAIASVNAVSSKQLILLTKLQYGGSTAPPQ